MAITFVISYKLQTIATIWWAKMGIQASIWVATVPMQVRGGVGADVGDRRDGPTVTRATGVIKSALVVVQANGAAASRKRTKPAQTSAQAAESPSTSITVGPLRWRLQPPDLDQDLLSAFPELLIGEAA